MKDTGICLVKRGALYTVISEREQIASYIGDFVDSSDLIVGRIFQGNCLAFAYKDSNKVIEIFCSGAYDDPVGRYSYVFIACKISRDGFSEFFYSVIRGL